jgi:NTP pyrophosphatase (non-canonical NTP hydrolase)
VIRGDVFLALKAMVEERDWGQFHTPENLAKSISIEAAELLECYQWGDADIQRVKEELADVITYCVLLADKLHLDTDQIVEDKLARTAAKYPVAKSKGKSTKYDRL